MALSLPVCLTEGRALIERSQIGGGRNKRHQTQMITSWPLDQATTKGIVWISLLLSFFTLVTLSSVWPPIVERVLNEEFD